jgi:hypothetical protein
MFQATHDDATRQLLVSSYEDSKCVPAINSKTDVPCETSTSSKHFASYQPEASMSRLSTHSKLEVKGALKLFSFYAIDTRLSDEASKVFVFSIPHEVLS